MDVPVVLPWGPPTCPLGVEGIVWVVARAVLDGFSGSAFLSHAGPPRITHAANKRVADDDLILGAKEDVIHIPFIAGAKRFEPIWVELDTASEPLHARITSSFPAFPYGSCFSREPKRVRDHGSTC